jgi:hypothetical protein
MDGTRWGQDDEALLAELAALLARQGAGPATLSEQDVVAAGRRAFTWRSVQAELDALLDPVAAAAAVVSGGGGAAPPDGVDAATVGQQLSAVVEEDHTVAEPAPPLLGTGHDDVGRGAVVVRGARTRWLSDAHGTDLRVDGRQRTGRHPLGGSGRRR